MKALILAAGFGTRLKPWTDLHPKALVPVEGIPMLQRVIENLIDQGFIEICINIHHFGDQIIDFLNRKNFKCRIHISDEREQILDTGGGLLKAYELFGNGEPILVHNVDILSNADLGGLYRQHCDNKSDATLLVSKRESNRKLIFNSEMELKGWHNLVSNEFLPTNFQPLDDSRECSFSGIYVVGKETIGEMSRLAQSESFPIMDYFLNDRREKKIKGYCDKDLILLDIGKPASLTQASNILSQLNPYLN